MHRPPKSHTSRTPPFRVGYEKPPFYGLVPDEPDEPYENRKSLNSSRSGRGKRRLFARSNFADFVWFVWFVWDTLKSLGFFVPYERHVPDGVWDSDDGHVPDGVRGQPHLSWQ
jgi:hypothetical protein